MTYRVWRKGSVLLATVSLFMVLEFLPPIDRFIDRGPPRLEPACSYLAENAGDEEATLYRTRADGDRP
ncbi:MAG: hypothetical protein M3N00_00175 [Actinomycetota bacterium]|nr:hypothetical protein [Actinomycetota bacterium]